MIIVTASEKYADVDTYGGCVAYAELLRQNGENAEAVLEGPLNASVTQSLRDLPVRYSQTYRSSEDDTFVLIDISEERVFSPFVVHERIREVIDHHPGFESFWANETHVKAQIEVVGAACTQIFERWEQAGKVSTMGQEIAKLLMAGILDNTLYLKATITTDRDRQAYKRLQSIVGDTGAFAEQYFEDCQQLIEADIVNAIANDVKYLEFPTIGFITIGQLAAWNTSHLLRQYHKELTLFTTDDSSRWFVNLIDIKNGYSTIFTTDKKTQAFLSPLLGITFDEAGLARAVRTWLRKEIMKAAIDASA